MLTQAGGLSGAAAWEQQCEVLETAMAQRKSQEEAIAELRHQLEVETERNNTVDSRWGKECEVTLCRLLLQQETGLALLLHHCVFIFSLCSNLYFLICLSVSVLCHLSLNVYLTLSITGLLSVSQCLSLSVCLSALSVSVSQCL